MSDGDLFTIAPGESFPITLGFGDVTPDTAQYGPHTGIDVGAPLGSGLDALLGGTVSAVQTEYLGGLEVKVTAPGGESVLFAHLSEADVAPGDVVTPDTFIGYTGASGAAVTGPHVHIETRNAGGQLIDPLTALRDAPSSGATNDAPCRLPGSKRINGVCLTAGGYGPAEDFVTNPAGPGKGPGTAKDQPVIDIPGAIGAAAGNTLTAAAIIVVVLALVAIGGRRIIGT